MIKKFICAGVFCCFMFHVAISEAAQKAALSLQWLTQCQFAGYYVALHKGWYMEEDIDITIKPGGGDLNPLQSVVSGESEFGTKWLADFITVKSQGQPLISVAQILQKNGLILIAKSKSGIRTPHDIIGKRVGLWSADFRVQFYALIHKFSIPKDRLAVRLIGWSIAPFIKDEVDVVNAMTYNEYLQVLDSGYSDKEIQVIDFEDYGVAFPGDILFTRQDVIEKHPKLCEGMVKASLRGWEYAIAHPEEAVDIVLKYDKTGRLARTHQIRQMREIIKLIQADKYPLGCHQPDQVRFVIQTMSDNKVILNTVEASSVFTNQFCEESKK